MKIQLSRLGRFLGPLLGLATEQDLAEAERRMMKTTAEVLNEIAEVKATLVKVKGEIEDVKTKLEEALAAQDLDAIAAAVDDLKGVSRSLDDLNQDKATPAPEPPAPAE